MSQRFCPRCGTQLMDNATFCHVCGSTCGTTNMPIPQNYPPQGAHQAPPAQPVYYVKPKVPGRGFGISSMVLGIVGAFYCFVLMMGMSVLSDAMNITGEILGEEFYYSSTSLDSAVYTSMFTAVLMYAIMPLLALIFGFNARKRGYQNGISTSGLILGSLGLVRVCSRLNSPLTFFAIWTRHCLVPTWFGQNAEGSVPYRMGFYHPSPIIHYQFSIIN